MGRKSFLAAEETKQKVTVLIYGQEYVVRGEEEPVYMEELARYVDKKMKQIAQHFPHLPVTKLAMLTALNIADELHKLQEDYNTLIRLIEEEKKA